MGKCIFQKCGALATANIESVENIYSTSIHKSSLKSRPRPSKRGSPHLIPHNWPTTCCIPGNLRKPAVLEQLQLKLSSSSLTPEWKVQRFSSLFQDCEVNTIENSHWRSAKEIEAPTKVVLAFCSSIVFLYTVYRDTKNHFTLFAQNTWTNMSETWYRTAHKYFLCFPYIWKVLMMALSKYSCCSQT